MSAGLPDDRNMWMKAFYGFDPENDGYVGWTQEAARDSFRNKISDGDIIMIYGASAPNTDKAQRSYVVGFLEVSTEAIRSFDKSSEFGLNRRMQAGNSDRWTYGIPVRRAWRAEERLSISTIAFETYRPEAGQSLAVHGAPLLPEEVSQALKIRVREVSVFGEPPITESDEKPSVFADVFKPSRAFPGSHGERNSDHKDGDAFLYLAIYEGDAHALLGRKKAFGDKNAAFKIGVTNNLKRRFKQLNSGIPPAANARWKEILVSPPYPNKKAAEDAEALFKEKSNGRLESLGKEFFWGTRDDAESLFWSIPGTSRF